MQYGQVLKIAVVTMHAEIIPRQHFVLAGCRGRSGAALPTTYINPNDADPQTNTYDKQNGAAKSEPRFLLSLCS